MSPFRLKAGQCFVESRSPALSIRVVDCSEPHYGEAYDVRTRSEPTTAPWPGSQELTRVDVSSAMAFRDFVGVAPSSSSLATRVFLPREKLWATGERHVIRFLTQPGSLTTGTLRGSHR